LKNGENLPQKNQWMVANVAKSKNSENNSKALGFRVVVGGEKKNFELRNSWLGEVIHELNTSCWGPLPTKGLP